MKPAQYIFLNKGLGMSTGKSAAQAAHASVNGYLLTPDNNTRRVWWRGGHHTKLVMECRDSDHLINTGRYLEARGIRVALVLDEGHTEVPPITPTALGTEVVDKDDAHIAATFSSFDLYRDLKPITMAEARDAAIDFYGLKRPKRRRRLLRGWGDDIKATGTARL